MYAPNTLRRLTALFILVLLGSTAWAGTIRDDEFDSSYLGLGSRTEYASVGQFIGSSNSGGFAASGTLIGANWVLTAGHVVSDANSLSFALGGNSYAATNWVAHPKWDGNLSKGYDIALVQFEQDLSLTGIAAATRYSGGDELGRIGTSVGFGMTGTGSTGATTFDQQKRAGTNTIDMWLRTPGKNPRVFLSDFDDPQNGSESSWGSEVPTALEYLIASGDSGGGVFIDVDGQEMLAGVHSFGWGVLDGDPDSDYGDASGHTRVSAFNDWIDSVINPGSGGGGNGKGKGNGGGNGGGGGKGGGRPFLLTGTPTPEPSSFVLATIGLLGLLGFCWRRRHAKR